MSMENDTVAYYQKKYKHNVKRLWSKSIPVVVISAISYIQSPAMIRPVDMQIPYQNSCFHVKSNTTYYLLCLAIHNQVIKKYP